jgi:hypothetical protein
VKQLAAKLGYCRGAAGYSTENNGKQQETTVKFEPGNQLKEEAAILKSDRPGALRSISVKVIPA